MDLVTMRTRLRKQIGSPDVGDVSNDDLTDYLNSAYRDIGSRYRFHRIRKLCVFETADGTDKYGLPADCEAVLQVRDKTTGAKVEKGGPRDEAWLHPETPTGKPTQYFRFRDWIHLDPVPDGVYSIEVFYKAGIVELEEDTDEPVLPEAWHEGIVKLARHKFYDEKGDIPKAQYSLANYNSWLSTKSIEVDEEKKDIDTGVVIPTLQRAPRSRQLSFDEE